MEEGNFVVDRRMIAKRYLRSWLVVDVPSAVPLELFEFSQLWAVSHDSELRELYYYSSVQFYLHITSETVNLTSGEGPCAS